MPAVTALRFARAAWTLLLLGVSACGGGGGGGGGGSYEAPRFAHVFLLVEENHDYAEVIGNPAMPYLNGLADAYGLATEYYADTHPSIGNYFVLTTGQVVTNDSAFAGPVTVDNLVRQLVAGGKTWKSYADALPAPGFLGTGVFGTYASRHNPVAYLSDVRDNPAQARNIVPFTQLAQDLAAGTLPAFGLIVPDLCHDAHDCPLKTADDWLSANVAPLIAHPRFQQDGLLIVMFDEASTADARHGGGRVAWIAVSPRLSRRGYRSNTLYQHSSTLRLVCRSLGLPGLPGAAADAPDMGEFFRPGSP